jgi:hypothetical protein
MANTTAIAETRPTFSRLTDRRPANSWKAAIPAVAVIVAFVALLAYLASRLSSYSQDLAASQRDAAASRQQYESALKRNAELQREATLIKGAGRTTVILQGKIKDGAWAAATWGESEGGKSWMRVSAYGLATPPSGKEYHLWVAPKSGDPVLVGALDPANDGSAFAMAGNLPAVDSAKSVLLSLDAENAKAPGQVLIETPLPTLKPELAVLPAQQAAPVQETTK